MNLVSIPSPTVIQVAASDEAGSRLVVLAKRTYAILANGVCVPAEQQIPLCSDLCLSREDPNLLEHDLDVIAEKPRTDVILHANACAGSPKPTLNVSIRVGVHHKLIAVFGDRRCSLSPTGAIVMSSAEPFEKIPMTFARAYGGRDRCAEARYGNPFAALTPYLAGTSIDADNQSPYLYPRNPCGRGYLIEPTREAVEQCQLPNLEDPRDLLSQSRLIVGHRDNWIYQPMPQGLGWMNWGWFPRAAFAGLIPEHRPQAAPIPEVARGLIARDVLEERVSEAVSEHAARFVNGAPVDLQLPFLSGDEEIELTHLHPAMKQWGFRLPGRPKRICTDGRNGKLNETAPVLQTVLIEPDESRVSVVWRGSAPALRPYFPEELAKMPLLVEW